MATCACVCLPGIVWQGGQGCSNVLDAWPSPGKNAESVLGSPVSTRWLVALGAQETSTSPLRGTRATAGGVGL